MAAPIDRGKKENGFPRGGQQSEQGRQIHAKGSLTGIHFWERVEDRELDRPWTGSKNRGGGGGRGKRARQREGTK